MSGAISFILNTVNRIASYIAGNTVLSVGFLAVAFNVFMIIFDKIKKLLF